MADDSWQSAMAWVVVVADDANGVPAVTGVAVCWHAVVQGSEVVY